LDCYGDPKFIGKIGTDILDNKCSWLINKALEIATPEQRAILDVTSYPLPPPLSLTPHTTKIDPNNQANYGRKDAECEMRVKQVFNQLKLDQLYYEYEEKVVGELKSKIAAVDESRGFKAEVLDVFLKKIYKRSK